jgi:integrase
MQKELSRVVTREKVKPGIWRRKSAKGRWVYEIAYRDSDGRQRRQVVRGGLKDAQTALAGIKARMGNGERVAPNPRLTFAVASAHWLEAKSPNLTPKTIATYRYGLDQHLLPAFGRMKLSEIDVTTVAKLVARMNTASYRRSVQERNGQEPTATTGYSAQTIKSTLIPLSRTFAYAKRHLGFAGENAVAALDLDERPGYKQRKPAKRKLGRDELDRLIEASESPWREIIATAAALGTRIGETLGLCWRHIDFETGLISIEQQANSTGKIARVKTETGVRRIEAPDWLMSMFRELKLRSPYSASDDLVFCTRTGQPHRHGNVRQRGLYAALDRAALPRTSFHSLRHTHASLWIKDGGDVITLSKRLGHSTPQVTMTTYAAEIEEANDHAARKARVNALFGQTQMAARLAAAYGDRRSQAMIGEGGEVVSLTDVRDPLQQAVIAAS